MLSFESVVFGSSVVHCPLLIAHCSLLIAQIRTSGEGRMFRGLSSCVRQMSCSVEAAGEGMLSYEARATAPEATSPA
ncbi:hypothetical protein, partial [Microbacterium sp. CPCC 204701]|uniref:hypothetical protein n=1 Tax=Microbacterium sp. CPCC 204701 TaxID=2493084 RepID=UPI00197C871C